MRIQLIPNGTTTTLATGANGIAAVTAANNNLSVVHTTVTFIASAPKIDNGILTGGAKSNALAAASHAAFDIASNLNTPTNSPTTDKA